MADALADDLRAHPGPQGAGGIRVAQIVKRDAGQTSPSAALTGRASRANRVGRRRASAHRLWHDADITPAISARSAGGHGIPTPVAEAHHIEVTVDMDVRPSGRSPVLNQEESVVVWKAAG